MTLGEKLRFYRTAQGYTQQAVAQRIGRSRATYTYYEMDKMQPNVRALYVIARFLNVPMEHLADDAYTPFGAEEFLAEQAARRSARQKKAAGRIDK